MLCRAASEWAPLGGAWVLRLPRPHLLAVLTVGGEAVSMHRAQAWEQRPSDVALHCTRPGRSSRHVACAGDSCFWLGPRFVVRFLRLRLASRSPRNYFLNSSAPKVLAHRRVCEALLCSCWAVAEIDPHYQESSRGRCRRSSRGLEYWKRHNK